MAISANELCILLFADSTRLEADLERLEYALDLFTSEVRSLSKINL